MKKMSIKIMCFILCVYFAFGGVYIYGADLSEAETEETTVSSVLEALEALQNLEALQDTAASIQDSAASLLMEDISSAEMTESFDVNSGMYIETIERGLEFISSVPNGAVVSDGVYFEIPSNITAELLKDGEYITFHNKTPIASQGYYILKLSAAGSSGAKTVSVFTFRIGTPPTNRVTTSEYKYPKVTSSATVAYDGSTGLYKYTLPNYKAFFSSVSGYGESVDSASFIIPRNLGYSFTRNGQALTYMNNKVYTEGGSYSLKIFGSSYASGGGYEAFYETTLNFTIYGEEDEESLVESSSGVVSSDTIEDIYSALSESVTGAVSSSVSDILSGSTAAEVNIISDTLLESYFETAGIYSESFSTGDTFYTNIPNDGIVGGNVYFDLPYNMSVSMTKDGSAVEFKNKSYINDDGSYILTVTDVFDGVTSRAKFSFRIQSGVESAFDVSSGISDSIDSIEDDTAEEAEAEGYSVSNRYDSEKGMFAFDCGDEVIYMSVPDGMVTNYDVQTEFSDSVDVVCEKDGEEINYSDSFTEEGRYTLIFYRSGQELSLSFDIAVNPVNYLDEFEAPEGYSILVAEYSDYGSVYDTESEEYLSGIEEIEDQAAHYDNPFELTLDGEYDFILQGSRGMPILSLSLFVDRLAPEIIFEGLDESMRTEEESVVVYCEETDAEVILTDSSGSETALDMSNGGGQISGTGLFTLTARDQAGNESVYEFALGSKAGSSGTFAVIAVAVILILILGAIIFAIVMIIRKLFGLGSTKEKKEKKDKKEKKEKKPKEKKEKGKKEEKKEESNIFEKQSKAGFNLSSVLGGFLKKKDKTDKEAEEPAQPVEDYKNSGYDEDDGWEEGYTDFDDDDYYDDDYDDDGDDADW